MEKATEDASEDMKRSDEYEFLRIGRRQKCAAVEKALARVKSMVHHPEAREQYMRLVSKFEKFEVIFLYGNIFLKTYLLQSNLSFWRSHFLRCLLLHH